MKLNVVGTTPAVKYTMHRTDAYVLFRCNYIKNNKQHLTVESKGRESLFICKCIMNTPQTTAGHREGRGGEGRERKEWGGRGEEGEGGVGREGRKMEECVGRRGCITREKYGPHHTPLNETLWLLSMWLA